MIFFSTKKDPCSAVSLAPYSIIDKAVHRYRYLEMFNGAKTARIGPVQQTPKLLAATGPKVAQNGKIGKVA
jgi:hypothetical protein